jgi:3-oxoacyl-[acyl-carrier-protein] synthase III
MRDAQILSTGSDAPDRVVTNADFAAQFGEQLVFCASSGGISLAASLWRWR